MWEIGDWKWLNRVAELLSQEKIELEQLSQVGKPNADAITHDLLDHGSLKKGKRSPRKKQDNPMPPVEVDHPTPRSEKTGLKLTFKNLGKNPIVTCTLKCVVSKKISFKNPNVEAPETSTANESSKDLGRNPQYTCKRRRDCQEEESTMKKKPKNVNLSRNLPQPPPALPQAFKSHILLMGGCLDDVILVIQKELYDTDVNKSQNRLSMPYSKVNIQFLTSKEVDHLDAPKAEIQATLIEPCLQECEISLRNWKSNSMFALVSPWKEVCRRNQLREGKVIQLWSFRRNSKLCFALVPIN